MLTIPQQFEELLKHPENILIMLKKNPLIADVAAATALKKILENSKKTVEITSENFRITSKMKFLTGISEIKDNISHLRKFVIRVDTSRTKVEELSYDQNGDHLDIFLMPSGGMFRKEDVETHEGDFRFDLIVCVGSPDLESLGQLYEKNSEFFYETPIVNIDHKPTNEHFGQVNIVDLTASSSAEIIYAIAKRFMADPFHPDLATLILAGMIAETKSFQKRISPQSLQIASNLISQGARREEIIQHLYFTKSLSLLKLWGKILTRLQKDDKYGIVWSYASADDMKISLDDGLEDIMEELIASSPEAKIIILFAETKPDAIAVSIQTIKNIDAQILAKPFTPNADHQSAQWTMAKNLMEAQTAVLESFKQTMESLPK
ncbi:MAG: hypothetical protein AAB793_01415 [Patescibacteria group bacterium]